MVNLSNKNAQEEVYIQYFILLFLLLLLFIIYCKLFFLEFLLGILETLLCLVSAPQVKSSPSVRCASDAHVVCDEADAFRTRTLLIHYFYGDCFFLSECFLFFFLFRLALQSNSSLGRLHETFRFISVTRSRTVGWTPWTSDQFVARPLPLHKHRKTHTQHKH
jgi:hypothetical protein